MLQSVCLAFLRDMRRRLGFPVLATPDDQYGMAALYVPFFDWATAHPVKEGVNWPITLEQRRGTLDAYWQGQGWAEVADAAVEAFVDAVRQVTALFQCDTCSQLLSYDHDRATYFCSECSAQETIPSKLPAYWFVRKD
jgi:hypothetical protein